MIEHLVIDGPDLNAKNTFAEPDKVKPRSAKILGNESEIRKIVLPKLSWNVLRFSKK